MMALCRFIPLAALALPVGLAAQTPPPADPPKPPATTQPAPQRPPARSGEPKPYAEVVTKEAVTQTGMFKVHRIDDKVLFEVPESAYGRDLLWQTEIAGVPSTGGFLFPGSPAGARVVKFERRKNKVFLRLADHSIRASDDAGLKQGVEMATFEPIAFAFDVEAEGEGKAAVIDVTRLYTSDPAEFAVKTALGGGNPDAGRTYIDRVSAFPTNIETRTMYTFSGPRGSTSALVHYSLVMLPEKPMAGRLADIRVGYFGVGYTAYGRPEHRAVPRTYISRFRLEKKDPNAAVSEPVKPITYYMPKETPAKWKKYIKLGVEDWRPAFEQAGFKNAIQCLEAPDDPNWDPEDARYSVIRWAPSTIQNAMGPSVQDPRSGETISAHVIMWHNILELLENWYFTQVSPLDPRAHKLPFPDELMGDLVRYVVAHEVGHTLGLRHNMKASSSIPVAQLRNPRFVDEYGISPSIMDYARFNYVAQPGDGVKGLRSVVSEYDRFAIEWGYKPIPGADTPEGERHALNQIASRQVSNPRVRFGEFNPTDPQVSSEDVGSDPVEAATLGFANLRRVMKLLVPATTQPGKDYTLLADTFSEVMGQMATETFHVLALVGGVYDDTHLQAAGKAVYRLVPKARQLAAVKFVADNLFKLDPAFLRTDVLSRLSPTGVNARLTGVQGTALNALFSENRVGRMLDLEATHGAKQVYTVREMFDQVQGSVWSEIKAKSVKIAGDRRALQRDYLRRMQTRLAAGASRSEFRAIGMAGMRGLAQAIRDCLPRVADRATREHLQQSLRDIDDIFNPKFQAPAPAAPPAFPFPFLDGTKAPCCWERAVIDR